MMKKIIVIFAVCLCAVSFRAEAQIKVNSNGNVGINNTSPIYNLDITGSFRIINSDEIIFESGEFYSLDYTNLGSYTSRWGDLYAISPTFTYSPDIDSDVNYKTDIREISDVSESIKQLRAVKYKLATDHLAKATKEEELYGFIAQEVMDIFPDIVTTRKDGKHGIRYTELIPVLVKAFQEQQQKIEELEAKIQGLETGKK